MSITAKQELEIEQIASEIKDIYTLIFNLSHVYSILEYRKNKNVYDKDIPIRFLNRLERLETRIFSILFHDSYVRMGYMASDYRKELPKIKTSSSKKQEDSKEQEKLLEQVRVIEKENSEEIMQMQLDKEQAGALELYETKGIDLDILYEIYRNALGKYKTEEYKNEDGTDTPFLQIMRGFISIKKPEIIKRHFKAHEENDMKEAHVREIVSYYLRAHNFEALPPKSKLNVLNRSALEQFLKKVGAPEMDIQSYLELVGEKTDEPTKKGLKKPKTYTASLEEAESLKTGDVDETDKIDDKLFAQQVICNTVKALENNSLKPWIIYTITIQACFDPSLLDFIPKEYIDKKLVQFAREYGEKHGRQSEVAILVAYQNISERIVRKNIRNALQAISNESIKLKN